MPALIDISIDVRAGERLLLVGPNGAGKSTFIRVFAGLMHASSGKALVVGRPARESRASVGVVSHATYLYDELTALENLRFYGELYGVAEPRLRGERLLELLRIEHLGGVQVGRLSRGQQQRVAIARALMHDPPVLLMDEPDTGLDVAALQVLTALLVDAGRTVVLTTHNLPTGLRLGTRVAVLSRGRLVEDTSASRVDATRLGEVLVDLS
jgi:heme exporter protein A